jgi:hypothetical protein
MARTLACGGELHGLQSETVNGREQGACGVAAARGMQCGKGMWPEADEKQTGYGQKAGSNEECAAGARTAGRRGRPRTGQRDLAEKFACQGEIDRSGCEDLANAFEMFRSFQKEKGGSLPINEGATPDLLLRRRDCAVFNYYLKLLAEEGRSYDSVRCGLAEGKPAFEGSGIQQKSHIQIAIRNDTCIPGLFIPR